MTGSPTSMSLCICLETLIKIFQRKPDAMVIVPDQVFEDATMEKYPYLGSVWCCMDVGKLCLHQSGDTNSQDNFCKDWNKSYMSHLLWFSAQIQTFQAVVEIFQVKFMIVQ